MLYTNAQINNLLLNCKIDATADCVREKIKAGHNHLEESEIGTRIPSRCRSWNWSDCDSKPFDAYLLAQTDASTSTLLRRMLALIVEEKATSRRRSGRPLIRMRQRAKTMK